MAQSAHGGAAPGATAITDAPLALRLTVVDPARSALRADVVLQAGPGTDAAQVRPLLLDAVGRDASSELGLFVAGRPVDEGMVLGEPPLVHGALVTVGRPGSDAGQVAGSVGGFLELHVVGGPDAGQVYRLTPGEHRIGRAGEATLRVDDPDCSRVHAQLEVSATGVALRDLGSTNGTWVDGQRIGEAPVALTERSRVLVGSSTLKVRVPDAVPAATHHPGDGHVDVNRSPRIVPPVRPVEVRMPVAPTPPRAVRVPVVAMVLPVLVAVPLAVLWNPMALLFGLMTPVMMLGNLVSDRATGRKEYRRELAAYTEARTVAEHRLDAAVTTEALRRRAAAPDAAELLRIATGPLQRLWERRRGDEDLLAVRLGTATLPSRITLVDPATDDEPATPEIDDVPVTVPLAEVGVLGIAGHRDRTVALVRSVLAQLAVLHSPRDLSMVVLAADAATGRACTGIVQAGGDWSAAAWLPHLRPATVSQEAEADCDALVGVTTDQVRRRVAELVALLERRQEERAPHGASRRWAGSHVVVLLDGAQRLRAVPGLPRLLEQGPAVGIHLLCLDSDPTRLPVECRGTVLVAGEVGTRLQVTVTGQAPLADVVADLPSARWMERLCRALAPLRDATPDSTGGRVPDGARLLDVLASVGATDPTDPDAVVAGWSGPGRSTSALLGLSAAGPHTVDLRRDGPHVLVAGTTGAGKSELLQTLIASLSLGNRPDEMGFVLVDYKGGSAFADCARLPHTLGVVTDLDEDLTRRALESLTAEVTRRERLLAAHGAKDIEDHQALVDAAPVGRRPPRLGRLVLVIDEFRVLAEELPDFLDGLVRIAAVGRSLGIHLVLATQRPGGVVSADIKANVNLRISLRVRDAADSLDVVDVRDAAGISERSPGRALSRTGSSPVAEFQTARVGGHALQPGAVAATTRRVSWPTLGEVPPRPPARAAAAGATDLARITDAFVTAGSRLADLEPAASPWLPPLPEVVALADLPRPDRAPDPGGETTALPFALLDLPAQQRQAAATFDVAGGSCLAVAGTARSGRTTVLRTLAVAAAQVPPAGAVAVYALDGGGGLTVLADLPHVGAVVPRDDTDRAARLLRRLTDEVARRQSVLAAGGFADIASQRRAGGPGDEPPLPYLLLLVDGWEALQQAHEDVEGGRALDAVQQLVRQGPGVGLVSVVSGDRGVLTGPLGGALDTTVVLRTADPTDAVLAGVAPRQVPRHLPPGRGLLVGPGGTHLLQVAVLAADPDGAAQRAAAQEAVRRAAAAPRANATPPFLVPPMPDVVTAADLRRAGTAGEAGGRWLPVGLGGNDVRPVGVDLARDGRRLVVAGHPGSGRSTALLAFGRALLAGRVPVAVVAPAPSPLAGLKSTEDGADVLGVFTTGDAEGLRACLDEALAAGTPAAVLVDDGDQVDGTVLEPVLLQLLDRMPTTGEVVVVAGSTPQLVGRFAGLTVQARKGAGGLLLGPAGPLDGDVLGVRLPRRTERRPGRGFLVRRGELVPVQVAVPGALPDA